MGRIDMGEILNSRDSRNFWRFSDFGCLNLVIDKIFKIDRKIDRNIEIDRKWEEIKIET